MKITLEQLPQQLDKQLASGYWLAGDEVFLQQIAADLIRARVKAAGFTERSVFQVDANFNFEMVHQQQNHYSLFNEKQLIELHLTQTKFTDSQRQALQTCAKNLNEDIFLLILSEKIEQQMQKAKWFQTIMETLCLVPIWPLAGAQYATWLKNRAVFHQVHLETPALQTLAQYTKGNTLAADQMLQQLKLLHSTAPISPSQVTELAHDAAQTDLFTFVDVLLTHDKQQTLTQLGLLKNQGIEPILIIWAIAREMRQLNAILSQVNQGASMHAALQTQHVWPSRQMLLTQACRHFSLVQIHGLIQQLATIDLQIKGAAPGDPWQSLERLLL